MSWTIDSAHSRVGFAIRHMMISTVRGEFTQFEGEVDLDEQDPSKSKASARIQVASIDTGNADRDNHLRGADFFDAQAYPTITFVSRKIEKKGGEGFTLTGDLTMHGVSKEITLDGELSQAAKDPWGKMRRGVALTGSLNRKDFGLNWNQALEAGGVLVDEKVKLEVEIEIVQAAPEEAAKLAEVEAASSRK
jgi:polyisoprenoid-binding protein YceI